MPRAKPKGPKVFQQRPGGTYFYKFELNGTTFRKTTGKYDKAEAQAFADQIWHAAHVEAADVNQDRAPSKRPKDMTLFDASIAFAESQVDRFTASKTETIRRLETVVEGIGSETRVSEITTKVVDAFATLRRNTVSDRTKRKLSASTVNGELAVLQWLLTYCAEIEEVPNLPRIAWSKARSVVAAKPIRRLSLDEQRVILDAAPDDYKRILIFALETGLRRENLVPRVETENRHGCPGLTWDAIDFANRTITVTTKGSKPLAIHMTDRLFELLSDTPRVPDCESVFTYGVEYAARWGRLFRKGERAPITYWSLGQWFDRHVSALIKAEKLTMRATLHDLRRTFGSETMTEVGLDRASKMLGHSSTKVTEAAYAVFLPKEVRDAAELSSRRRHLNRGAPRPAA